MPAIKPNSLLNPMYKMSASQLAEAVRQKQYSVSEVVEAHIQRAEQFNSRINAIIARLYDEARAQAQTCDEHIAQYGTDDLPPLYGVPITIKDSFEMEGILATAGSWYRRETIATQTASAVHRLQEAGAIVIAKSSCPDMCWSGETVNPIIGFTRNPHDVRYTAGGSSGGEGALIASGASPLGLGSDIAGSVRIPAAANGCVSLKPTGGRIPNDGHIPMPAPDIHDWNTAGAMARRVEDLVLALNVLSNTPVRDVDAIEIKGRRAYTFATFYTRGIVRETLGMAAGALQTQGMQTESMGSHIIDRATLAYFAIFERTNGKLLRQALGGGAYNLGDELKAHLQGKGRITPQVMYFTHAMQALGWLARLLGFGKIDKLENLRQQFNEALGDGVLLAPILVTPPKKHKWLWNLHMQIPTTLMFNALGVPSVAIPIRWQDNGLPLAIQVIAAQGNDEIALAVAGELERIFGGWRPART